MDYKDILIDRDSRPEFSVLISVYKNDDVGFFETALKSVTTEQLLKPLQVVVVCDGPVDTAVDTVIEKVRNENLDIEFTVIKKSENKGLAAALNTGLAECKYAWVARMDSDDISVPDRFEKQFLYLRSNQNVSVLGGFVSEFESDPQKPVSTRAVGLSHAEIVEMAKTRSPMNHVTVVYRKNDILKLGGYSENFGKLEDYKLWVDAITAGLKFANIPDISVLVRIGNGFLERRSNKREIQDWDMLQGYLLQAGLINKSKARKNKIYIRIFIRTPKWIKKILYKTVLRKKVKSDKK